MVFHLRTLFPPAFASPTHERGQKKLTKATDIYNSELIPNIRHFLYWYFVILDARKAQYGSRLSFRLLFNCKMHGATFACVNFVNL